MTDEIGGYVAIPNDVLDALCRTRISGQEHQILDVIIRKTIGWGKKEDHISLSQFSDMTGINKPHILRGIYSLVDKKMIVVTQNGNGLKKFSINVEISEWEPLPKKATTFKPVSTLKEFCYLCGFTEAIESHHIVPRSEGGSNKINNKVMLCPNCHTLCHKGKFDREELLHKKARVESVANNDNGSDQKVTQPLSKMEPTTDNSTKDTSLTEYIESDIEYLLANLLFTLIRERAPNFKKPDLQRWCDPIEKLIRLDKQTPTDIANVIRWCQEDDFWRNNILSTDKLRKQFFQLFMKMNDKQHPMKGKLTPTGQKAYDVIKEWRPKE